MASIDAQERVDVDFDKINIRVWECFYIIGVPLKKSFVSEQSGMCILCVRACMRVCYSCRLLTKALWFCVLITVIKVSHINMYT